MFGHVDVCLKFFLPLAFVDASPVGVVVVITRRHLCHIGVVVVGVTILTLKIEFLFEMSVPIVLDIVVGPLR